MKKLVAAIFGLILTSLFVTTVSAEEYEVKKGDTLWDIANEYNTTVETLMTNNNLKDTLIYPKQVLELDEKKESDIEYYVVKKGDTLTDISEKFGEDVTVGYLKNANNLNSELIYAGEKLIVGGVSASKTDFATTTAAVDKPKETKQEVVQNNSKPKNEQVKNSPQPKEVEKQETKEIATASESKPSGQTLTVEATAYTAYCDGCSGITANGTDLRSNPNAKVIAVDPNVIPLGTEVYVEGYGHAVAADTGGAIKGNKIDIHVPTKDEAYNWGRRTVNVTIVK